MAVPKEATVPPWKRWEVSDGLVALQAKIDTQVAVQERVLREGRVRPPQT